MTVAQEILQQLGGNKFLVMTGSKQLVYSEATEADPRPWLRMNLIPNKSGANRLQIFLDANDTCTVRFYRMTIKNHVEAVITKEQVFSGIYGDQLREIFTSVTGLYTSLGTMAG